MNEKDSIVRVGYVLVFVFVCQLRREAEVVRADLE